MHATETPSLTLARVVTLDELRVGDIFLFDRISPWSRYVRLPSDAGRLRCRLLRGKRRPLPPMDFVPVAGRTFVLWRRFGKP